VEESGDLLIPRVRGDTFVTGCNWEGLFEGVADADVKLKDGKVIIAGRKVKVGLVNVSTEEVAIGLFTGVGRGAEVVELLTSAACKVMGVSVAVVVEDKA